MTTFLRTHQTVSRFLIASIWVVVTLSDLTGTRVVNKNISTTLQMHDTISRLRRCDAILTLIA